PPPGYPPPAPVRPRRARDRVHRAPPTHARPRRRHTHTVCRDPLRLAHTNCRGPFRLAHTDRRELFRLAHTDECAGSRRVVPPAGKRHAYGAPMTETERLLPASGTPRPTAIILAAPPTERPWRSPQPASALPCAPSGRGPRPSPARLGALCRGYDSWLGR